MVNPQVHRFHLLVRRSWWWALLSFSNIINNFSGILRILLVNTFNSEKISKEAIEKIVEEKSDLRPKSLINMLDLKRPIYLPTAAYGHFGRTDIDLSWERTNKASEISQ